MKKLLHLLVLLGTISSVGVLQADGCCSHGSTAQFAGDDDEEKVDEEEVDEAAEVEGVEQE